MKYICKGQRQYVCIPWLTELKKSNAAVLGTFCTPYFVDLCFIEIYFRCFMEEKLLIQIVRLFYKK